MVLYAKENISCKLVNLFISSGESEIIALEFGISNIKCRSSRPEEFCKKVVLKSFAKFTGKHLCQILFFHKVASPGRSPSSSPLLKKRLWHRCFPVNFLKFLRAPFLLTSSGGCFSKWLLLGLFKPPSVHDVTFLEQMKLALNNCINHMNILFL